MVLSNLNPQSFKIFQHSQNIIVYRTLQPASQDLKHSLPIFALLVVFIGVAFDKYCFFVAQMF